MNFKNRLRFDGVTAMSLVVYFFLEHCAYIQHRRRTHAVSNHLLTVLTTHNTANKLSKTLFSTY